MKRSIHRLLSIFCAGMFVFAGCAKHVVVRKDEPVVPSVAAAPLNQGASTAKMTDTTNEKSLFLDSGGQKKSQQTYETRETADLRKMFEKIYFNFDSATLSDTARQALAKNFALLKQNPQSRIRVEGNCDERGSDEYNLALGERRAQAAVRYLTTMGVPAERLSTISYGKEKPADPGHDEAALVKNRRDEFVISK